MKKSYKIAFITSFDPEDRRAWSGSIHYIAESLKKHVGEIENLGPVPIPFERIKMMVSKNIRRITGKISYPDRSVAASMHYARIFERKLERKKYDFIVAPAASVEIANIETRVPIVYISDATFNIVKNDYSIFSTLSEKTLEDQERLERQSIEKSSLCVYPSKWAANSAIEDYKADKNKVKVIQFGANLDSVPEKELVTNKKIDDKIRMLFLAKEWDRKGGQTAFDTLLALESIGIEAELTILGVTPPKHIKHRNLKVIHYLNKNIQNERTKFNEILLKSHLLLLPTKTECFGLVFCEANAYGLPVFTRGVGGISSIVKNGINGFLHGKNESGTEFAKSIFNATRDKLIYSNLNKNSRKRFEEKLNWDFFGKELKRNLDKLTYGET
ncbi:MAG: glycosyltransferase family 4 protein [Desulfobacterales bacterium]|nr:glycosyltransferase family 4 protein [Desulfobacterales bacterium]MCP4163558.1 glycosyltransferase family 4 protein [Deltaproteobacteria bacterium]